MSRGKMLQDKTTQECDFIEYVDPDKTTNYTCQRDLP